MQASLRIRGQGLFKLRPGLSRRNPASTFPHKLRIASTYVMRPCCQL